MKKRHALSLPQKVIETMAFVLCSALVSFTPLHGAEPPAVTGASYALLKGTKEFGLWAGGSPDPTKIFGKTEDRHLLLSGLAYGRFLAAWEPLSLEYLLDIFPAA